MPKRKAARKDHSVEIQPSLLHSLPRPTDPEQLSIWTANVRDRLAVIQGGICKLESEKQVLLSLLGDASNDIKEVVTEAQSSEVCPMGDAPKGSTDALWNAAQGFPSNDLVSNINQDSIHPGLKYDLKSLPEPSDPGPSENFSKADAKGNQRSVHLKSSSCAWTSKPAATTGPSGSRCRDLDLSEPENHPTELMESMEALSHVPDVPGGSVYKSDTDVNMAPPRSPSMASTILLSSEDEGAEAEARATVVEPERPQHSEQPEQPEHSSVQRLCPEKLKTVETSSLWRRWRRGVLQPPAQQDQGCAHQNRTDARSEMQPSQTTALNKSSSSSSGLGEHLASPPTPLGLGLLERLQRKLSDSQSNIDKLDLALADFVDPETERPEKTTGKAVDIQTEETKEGKKSEEPGPSSDSLQPESLTDEELRSWMQCFGLKPQPSREFMIRRIHDIVDYIDGGTAWLQSIWEAPPPVKKSTKRKERNAAKEKTPKKKDTSTIASPKAKSRPKAASPKAPDSVSPEAKFEKKLDLIADAIRKDKDLYEKLLTFEPIELREVKRRIVEVTPELRSLGEQRLRKYLDEQGFASVS